MVDFWSLIGVNALSNHVDVKAAIARVTARLSQLDQPGNLIAFQESLDDRLADLDIADLASIPVELSNGFVAEQTSDHFLYARCACVLAGREDFFRVLRDGPYFGRFIVPRLQSSEELLYLARVEYENKTGKQMPRRDA